MSVFSLPIPLFFAMILEICPFALVLHSMITAEEEMEVETTGTEETVCWKIRYHIKTNIAQAYAGIVFCVISPLNLIRISLHVAPV